MFSIKQGYDLKDSKELHKQITLWCQKTANNGYMSVDYKVSQFLQEKIIEEIVDKYLSKKHNDLYMSDEYKLINFGYRYNNG